MITGSFFNKDLKLIYCPKCKCHGAVLNIKTGVITCQYCMFSNKKEYD